MLDALKNTMANLQAFDFKQELEKIVTENSAEIEELQRRQLYAGVDRNSEEIELKDNPDGKYRPSTIAAKEKKGQPTDRITWKDTGELYSTLEVKIEGDEFNLTSENFKFKELVKRSGPNTVGLDQASRKEFAERFTLPLIKKSLKQKTGFDIK